MLSSDTAPIDPSPARSLADALTQGRIVNRNANGLTAVAFATTSAAASALAVQRLTSGAIASSPYRERAAHCYAALEGKRVEGLPTLLRVARAEAGLALLLEALDGEPLDQFIATRTEPVDGPRSQQIVSMIGRLAGALLTLHRASLLHLDVRPSAITIDAPTGRVAFTDFGLAHPHDPFDEASAALAGRGLSDLPYASAEILAHEPPHPSDDVYSLACVAYELLTGLHPYARRSAIEAADGAVQPTVVAGLSDRQNQVLLGALVTKRNQRSITMRELASAFSPPESWQQRMRTIAMNAPRRGLLMAAASGLFVLGAMTQWMFDRALSDGPSRSVRESARSTAIVDARESTSIAVFDVSSPGSNTDFAEASRANEAPVQGSAPKSASKNRAVQRPPESITTTGKAQSREAAVSENASMRATPGGLVAGPAGPVNSSVSSPVTGPNPVTNTATRGLATYACPSCSCTDLRAKRFLDGQSLTWEEANYYLNVCAMTG